MVTMLLNCLYAEITPNLLVISLLGGRVPKFPINYYTFATRDVLPVYISLNIQTQKHDIFFSGKAIHVDNVFQMLVRNALALQNF